MEGALDISFVYTSGARGAGQCTILDLYFFTFLGWPLGGAFEAQVTSHPQFFFFFRFWRNFPDVDDGRTVQFKEFAAGPVFPVIRLFTPTRSLPTPAQSSRKPTKSYRHFKKKKDYRTERGAKLALRVVNLRLKMTDVDGGFTVSCKTCFSKVLFTVTTTTIPRPILYSQGSSSSIIAPEPTIAVYGKHRLP